MRFVKNCKGAISIYLCIIFIALLMLAGVIIDAVRIMVAERKVENALSTAVRSVLAGYNPDLVGDYSIFGIDARSDKNTVEEKFLHYLRQNLIERNPNFRFLKYEICTDGETFIEGSGSFLRGYDFRNQVLQYMKYKAPIAVAHNIFDKIKSSGLSRKLEFARSEQQVRARWKAVNRQKDSVNSLVEKVKKSTGKDLQSFMDMRQKLQEALELNENIAYMLQAYEEEKMKSDAVALSPSGSGEDETAHKISTVRTSFEGLQSASDTLKSQITANIAALDDVIERTKQTQDELASLNAGASALRSRIEDLNRQIENLEKNGKENKNGPNESQINGLREEVRELTVRLESLEEQIRDCSIRLEEMQASFQLADMSLLPEEEPGTPRSELNTELEKSAKGLIDRLVKGIGLKRMDIDEDKLIKDSEFESQGTKTDGQGFESGLADRDGTLGEDEAEIENRNVMQFMKQIVDAVADAGESSLEKIYIVEYIMDRFSYFTSKAERGHFFEKGEVEYILWGDNNWTQNVIKTIGTIWSIRFAINAVDTFATSPIPEPVTRLINSLIEGFLLSCKDMMDLCQGKEVSICPSLKGTVRLSYADHLRICLLLASSTDKGEITSLNRIRQLIQINIKELDDGFALKNYSTLLHGRVKVKIDLWFLPMFRLDKVGLKNFEGGSYIIEKETFIGY